MVLTYNFLRPDFPTKPSNPASIVLKAYCSSFGPLHGRELLSTGCMPNPDVNVCLQKQSPNLLRWLATASD